MRADSRAWGRDEGDEGASGAPSGVLQTRAGEGGLGEPDLCRSQRVFGAESTDWGGSGSQAVHGAGRNLVRTAEAGRDAALTGTAEAPGGLPPHHRLVDPQAGSVG